ncbi:hypothetical protein QVD17_27476 [Tagetes erecta]|uniref:Uncharacterized protein n=1 Tax=Tagetes erecta TaxID=13708 RepID=A0AAD8K952_TARER|nr:hypothetical protein QVD17_27476 [Tagetes erecta]
MVCVLLIIWFDSSKYYFPGTSLTMLLLGCFEVTPIWLFCFQFSRAVLDAGAFPHLINLLSHSNEKQVKSKGDHFPSSTLSIYPLQKNKMVNGEVVDDGFRIEGRTRRGFRSAQVVTPAVEKFCNVATAKQSRTARLSFDKSERQGIPLGNFLTAKLILVKSKPHLMLQIFP